MEQKTNSNIHKGHRARLRNLIDNVGLDSLSDVQIVEQILTMTISRCDTNVIAHRLLDRFGSIANILDSDAEDLCEVEGIGKITAKNISYLPQIFNAYTRDKSKHKYTCKTYKDINDFFRPLFDTVRGEAVFVGFLNSNSIFTSYNKLGEGDFSNVKIERLELTKMVMRNKAKAIIIAHNHPIGKAIPSCSDVDANTNLCVLLSNLGIALYDNIIIGEDGLYSFRSRIFVPC